MAVDLVLPALPLPRRAVIGAKESIDLIGKRTVRRTLGGRAVPLRPAYGRRYRVTLSNSGDAVWMPHVDRLGRDNGWFQYRAAAWWATYIAPGQTQVTLERDAFRMAARDVLDETILVDATRAGRVVTIAARTKPTVILYRPIFEVVIVECDGMTADATGRSQGWKLVMEERA